MVFELKNKNKIVNPSFRTPRISLFTGTTDMGSVPVLTRVPGYGYGTRNRTRVPVNKRVQMPGRQSAIIKNRHFDQI